MKQSLISFFRKDTHNITYGVVLIILTFFVSILVTANITGRPVFAINSAAANAQYPQNSVEDRVGMEHRTMRAATGASTSPAVLPVNAATSAAATLNSQ